MRLDRVVLRQNIHLALDNEYITRSQQFEVDAACLELTKSDLFSVVACLNRSIVRARVVQAMTDSPNWNIIGHSWAVDFLRRSIAGGHAAHAYLLSGPASAGKSLLALRLAQALKCETGGPDPCLICRACKRIE